MDQLKVESSIKATQQPPRAKTIRLNKGLTVNKIVERKRALGALFSVFDVDSGYTLHPHVGTGAGPWNAYVYRRGGEVIR